MFRESLGDPYFIFTFPSDDRFRPALRVYPGSGNNYINAVMVTVNIRL